MASEDTGGPPAAAPMLASTLGMVEKDAGGRPYLLVFLAGSMSVVPLSEDRVYVLGRDPNVELPLDDAVISRRHASLALAGAKATLSDLGSANGTRLNGRAVTEPVALRSGDVRAGDRAADLQQGPGVARRPGRLERLPAHVLADQERLVAELPDAIDAPEVRVLQARQDARHGDAPLALGGSGRRARRGEEAQHDGAVEQPVVRQERAVVGGEPDRPQQAVAVDLRREAHACLPYHKWRA